MIVSPFQHPLIAKISVPGSKSLTNRLFALAVLCEDPLIITDTLESEDAEIMRNALSTMGAIIEAQDKKNTWKVSQGTFFENTTDYEIFCGNSGTSIRFLTALCALRKGTTILTGIERMKKRPIGDLANALEQMGVQIEYLENTGFPPLKIIPPSQWKTHEISLSGKLSSQFFSALFHIAPKMGLTISVEGDLVSIPYAQMTIELMRQFEIDIQNEQYKQFTIPVQKYISPKSIQTEGDASSASYPLAIGAITGGKVEISNIPKNSLQGDAKFYETVILPMTKEKGKLLPLGEINMEDMPDVSLTAAMLCTYAKGYSKITGLSTLRHKECDRLDALEINLKKMGANIKTGPDWIEIWGDPNALHGADIECFNDHRVAMCFAVLGCVIEGVNILDPDCTKKTYPEFWEDLEAWKHL